MKFLHSVKLALKVIAQPNKKAAGIDWQLLFFALHQFYAFAMHADNPAGLWNLPDMKCTSYSPLHQVLQDFAEIMAFPLNEKLIY